MAKILVLGGGRQGRVIAEDLSDKHSVTVADVRPIRIDGITTVTADLSDAPTVTAMMREHDLAVGALPAQLGFAAAKCAIEAGVNYVDVAFFAEDVGQLDAAARAKGISIVPDAGLAPGLSNLIVGRALAIADREEVHIMVGGVAVDKTKPYGYVISWSPADLLDEYIRPARIISEGKVTTVPALTGLEIVTIPGVGEMECFYTDGLRTLLEMKVREGSEKTLRWPGHVAAIQPLMKNGTFIEELETKCKEGDDLVVFRIQADDQVVTMVDRAKDGMSAMARTTALTCAAFARWAAEGKVRDKGVVTPEKLGADPVAYRFIMDAVAKRGIVFNPPLPFYVTP